MDIQIREASEDDIPAMIPLWKELMMFHEPYDEIFVMKENAETQWASYVKTLIDSQKENKIRIFLAEIKSSNELVGYIVAKIEKNIPIFKIEEYGSVGSISVTESHRQQHIGMKLVDEVKKWFKSQNIHRIHLGVATKNPVSNSFWRKMGFVPYMETLYFTES